MNRKILFLVVISLVAPILAGVAATDFTITRQLGDVSNSMVIETSTGTDQFWVDKDGYAYSNASLVITNGLNVGGEHEIFAGNTGDVMQFRTIQAGNGTTITTDGSVIRINATGAGGAGEANTASNVGTGVGVFQTKNGVDLQFHSLLAGAGVTINDIGDELRINSTGGVTTLESLTNVTDTGCAQDQIRQVSGANWICADLPGATTVTYPYDYFITTDGSTYTAYNGTYDVVSSNADLDTVWTAIKADTDYVNNEHINIQIGSGEFVTTNGFDIQRSNTTFSGSGMGVTWIILDTDSADNEIGIFLGSTSLTSTARNIANASQGAVTVTTNTASHAGDFNVGDLVYLASAQIIGELPTHTRGEFQRVNASNAGTGLVTLTGRIFEDYLTVGGTSPTIRLVNPLVRDITITDLSIYNKRIQQTVPSTFASGIYGQWVENVIVDRVEVTKTFWSGMVFTAAKDIKINNCNVHQLRHASDTLSYGVIFTGVFQGGTIQNCNFEQVRYGVAHGEGTSTSGNAGEIRNTLVDGNTVFQPNYACFDSHSTSVMPIFSNNRCIGRNQDQQTVSGDPTYVDGIKVRTSAVITNNVILNIDSLCINAFQSELGTESEDMIGPRRMIVTGNFCENAETGIYIENTTNAIIANNELLDITSQAIYLTHNGNTRSGEEYYALITNNIIRDSSSSVASILINYKADVIGNSLFNSGGGSGGAIYLIDSFNNQDVSKSSVRDNRVEVTASNCLHVAGGNRIIVDGNYCYRPSISCIRATTNIDFDLSNSTITNNVCDSTDYPTGTGDFGFNLEDIVGSYIAHNYFNNVSSSTAALRIAVDADDNMILGNVFNSNIVDPIDIIAGTNTCLDNYRLNGVAADTAPTCPT